MALQVVAAASTIAVLPCFRNQHRDLSIFRKPAAPLVHSVRVFKRPYPGRAVRVRCMAVEKRKHGSSSWRSAMKDDASSTPRKSKSASLKRRHGTAFGSKPQQDSRVHWLLSAAASAASGFSLNGNFIPLSLERLPLLANLQLMLAAAATSEVVKAVFQTSKAGGEIAAHVEGWFHSLIGSFKSGTSKKSSTVQQPQICNSSKLDAPAAAPSMPVTFQPLPPRRGSSAASDARQRLDALRAQNGKLKEERTMAAQQVTALRSELSQLSAKMETLSSAAKSPAITTAAVAAMISSSKTAPNVLPPSTETTLPSTPPRQESSVKTGIAAALADRDMAMSGLSSISNQLTAVARRVEKLRSRPSLLSSHPMLDERVRAVVAQNRLLQKQKRQESERTNVAINMPLMPAPLPLSASEGMVSSLSDAAAVRRAETAAARAAAAGAVVRRSPKAEGMNVESQLRQAEDDWQHYNGAVSWLRSQLTTHREEAAEKEANLAAALSFAEQRADEEEQRVKQLRLQLEEQRSHDSAPSFWQRMAQLETRLGRVKPPSQSASSFHPSISAAALSPTTPSHPPLSSSPLSSFLTQLETSASQQQQQQQKKSVKIAPLLERKVLTQRATGRKAADMTLEDYKVCARATFVSFVNLNSSQREQEEGVDMLVQDLVSKGADPQLIRHFIEGDLMAATKAAEKQEEPAAGRCSLDELRVYGRAIRAAYVDVTMPAKEQEAGLSLLVEELVSMGGDASWARAFVINDLMHHTH